jgi:sensor domain CHASE-containing protein
LEERLKANGRGLAQMARRWEFYGGMPRAAWEADISGWYNNLEGVQAIEWADRSHHVQWIVPLKGNEAAQGFDLRGDERRWEAHRASARSGKAGLFAAHELAQGVKGFILCIPLFRRGQFDGHLLLVYRAREFFAPLFKRYEQPGDSFAFFDGQEEIFRIGAAHTAGRDKYTSEAELDFFGTRLQLVVQPSQARIAADKSMLPWVALLGGLLLSTLSGLLAHQTQTSRRRARRLDRLVEQLRQETI